MAMRAFGPEHNCPHCALDEIRHRMVLPFAQERDSGCCKIHLRPCLRKKAAEDVCLELLKVGSIAKRDARGHAVPRAHVSLFDAGKTQRVGVKSTVFGLRLQQSSLVDANDFPLLPALWLVAVSVAASLRCVWTRDRMVSFSKCFR